MGQEESHGMTLPGNQDYVMNWSMLDQFKTECVRCVGRIGRPAVKSGVRFANSMSYWWSTWRDWEVIQQRSLFHSIYYPPAAFTGYRTLLPKGTETFQAFVPNSQAELLFKEIVRRSQENDFMHP